MREISTVKIEGDAVRWEQIEWNSEPEHLNIQGRQQHSAVHFRGKIYLFGGCFSFNRKRHARECTNQVLEFDPFLWTMTIVKTVGQAVNSRKNHTAVTYKNSMVVFGGASENDFIFSDMLVLNFEDCEWTRIPFSGYQGACFTQGAACTVVARKDATNYNVRKVSLPLV